MTRLPLALLVAMALILAGAKPTACPTPSPTPTPTPPPTGGTSGSIIVTTNDVTIDGKAFSGTKGTGYAIHAVGTAS